MLFGIFSYATCTIYKGSTFGALGLLLSSCPVEPNNLPGEVDLKKFCLVVFALLSALFVSIILPGCGGSSHHPLFLIAAGSPSIGDFDIGGGGALTLQNLSFPAGSDPTGIIMDSQRRYAFVLNNAGPSIAGGVLQYTIDAGHGSLTVVQAPSHATNITGPVGPVPTGLSPLSIAIDDSNNFVFVANADSNNISVYSLDQTTGALTQVANSPFTTGATPVSVVSRGGSLFVANQGAATISVYTFDSKTGALALSGTPTTVGADTTAITADPAGKVLFVADGTANTVSTFTISGSGIAASGSTPVGTDPVNLFVDPSGKYLYVADSGSNDVAAFTISSGSLNAISGSPFAVGTSPSYITSNHDGSLLFVANKGSASVSSFSIGGGGGLTAAKGSPFAATGFNAPNGLLTPE